MTNPFTFHRLPFTMRYLFSVIHYQWLMANGKCMANGKWKTENGTFCGGTT